MKVSIITVCYNSENTIEQTIQSVINQSYNNIEYIIIDGGSTDGTLDIIKKYEDKIASWRSESDNGIYDAMNKGIKKATGDIIGIINSDDWYDCNTLQHVVKVFCENQNVDIVHGDEITVNEYGKELGRRKVRKVASDSLYAIPNFIHPSFFIKKDMYMKYGFFDCSYKIAADYELVLRMYLAGAKFYYEENDLVYFRWGGVSNNQHRWRGMMEEKKISLNYIKTIPVEQRESHYCNLYHFFETKRMYFLYKFINNRVNWKYSSKDSKEKYIIFGTGDVGLELYSWLCGKNKKGPVFGFVDNSKEKQKELIDGMPVYSVNDLIKYKGNFSKIIIASIKYKKEMEEQLKQMGFIYKRDFLFVLELKEHLTQRFLKNYFKWGQIPKSHNIFTYDSFCKRFCK